MDIPQSPPPPRAPLPVPPEVFNFPIQLLEQWVQIPAEERINTTGLTRQDIDHLLFSMLRMTEAQSKLELMVVEWSNGRLDTANKAQGEFQRLNVEGLNHIRQFFTAFMTAALQARSNAK